MKEKRVATTAERLRAAMEAASMKKADLARASGLNPANICRYLSGENEPKQAAIEKLAAALGVDGMWLLGYDVPMTDPREEEPDRFPIQPLYIKGSIMQNHTKYKIFYT